CSICLEPFSDRQLLRHLACGHPFHAVCIDKWFSQNAQKDPVCPLCQAPHA
ncbi:ring finger protein 13, partial [Martensiomyces pterosporus]